MVGYWKVYGDEEKAKKIFDKYRKCSQVYLDRFERGYTLEKLTVARKRIS
jgi:aminopeptidase N